MQYFFSSSHMMYCLLLVFLGLISYVLLCSRTGIQSTDTVLRRLVRTSVQTGLFVTVFSMGDLISFLLAPNMKLHGMFAIPIGRIYTNVSEFFSEFMNQH